MRALTVPSLLLAASMLASCASSSNWQTTEVTVAVKCPQPGADLTAEAKRKPAIAGETAIQVAGHLVAQVRRKNAALKRALAAYQACRNV